MSKVATVSDDKPNSSDGGPWSEGIRGERIAVRVSSLQTNGAYAVVESFAEPGCATPMHLHRNEEEHFVVVSASTALHLRIRCLTYRLAGFSNWLVL
jgi:quercetin dioxygenase-like cupin family protein